jgi:RNA recognition motif-containing protein
VYHVNQLSKRSIVFDVRENLKKKIQQVLAQIEKKDNLLESIFRLRLVTNEEMISNFADEEIEFTAEEYENAVFNRQNLEVVVRGLSYSVDEDMLFKFFRNSNIKIVQVKLLRDDMGSSRGLAFVLCLN